MEQRDAANRTMQLKIRLRKDEMEELRRLAKSDRNTISQFVRNAIFSARDSMSCLPAETEDEE